MGLREEFAQPETLVPPIQPGPPDKIEFIDPHHKLSNKSPHSVLYDGKGWRTAEHLFQAWKVRPPKVQFEDDLYER